MHGVRAVFSPRWRQITLAALATAVLVVGVASAVDVENLYPFALA
jgi:hypothetical protein